MTVMTADQPNLLPKHIAIIPDGNRRWAKARGLTTKEGHQAGYENFKTIGRAAFDRGVEVVTYFAFSTENWNRTKDEVGYLMKLATWVMEEEAEEYNNQGIRLKIAGSADGLDLKLAKSLRAVEELTKDNTKGTICLCFNYGGRGDIVQAVNRAIAAGENEITEDSLATNLTTADLPDPELVIRTSGEQRLSNFMLWETAYSELYFSPKLWPAFEESDLDTALEDFAHRQRNFGA